MTTRLFIAIAIYAAVLKASVVPYKCEAVPPEPECTAEARGAYRMSIYSHEWFKYPVAVADAHCVEMVGNRLKAYEVRLTHYTAHSTEIKGVEWHDEQEFPTRNIELCKVGM